MYDIEKCTPRSVRAQLLKIKKIVVIKTKMTKVLLRHSRAHPKKTKFAF